MANFLRYEFQRRRGTILGWGIGLSLYAAMYLLFYPAFPPEMIEIDFSSIEIYQAFGEMDMATFEGYAASAVLNILSVLAGIFAITSGTATLAGEEDDGTLELLVALPLSRWQVVLVKAVALGLAAFIILVILATASAMAFIGIQGQLETSVTAGQLFALILGIWPITMAFTMMGLFLGAFLPNRRTATATAAIALVASYFGSNLAPLVEALEPLKPVFLYQYYDRSARVFTEGMAAGDVLVLLGTAAAFLLLAILAFQRRNITVGAWPWQRARIPS